MDYNTAEIIASVKHLLTSLREPVKETSQIFDASTLLQPFLILMIIWYLINQDKHIKTCQPQPYMYPQQYMQRPMIPEYQILNKFNNLSPY